MKALRTVILIGFLIMLIFPGYSPATVNNSTARNDYNANGSTTAFAYTFRILDKTNIEVIDIDANGGETVKTVDTDYTVDGLGAAGGGNVNFLAAPASGHTIVILRKQPITQPSDYILNEGFPSDRVEQDLDKQSMVDQMQNEQLSRALKLPKRSTMTNLSVPTPAECSSSNRFLAWKTDFTALECAAAAGLQGPPGPAGGYGTILDEGGALTQRNSVNFTGSGVSCVDNAGASRTDCTVSSGGGSTDVQIFTTTGAYIWTKPANAKFTEVYLVGGGGGGGSGRRGAASTSRGGGCGGGGGGYSWRGIQSSLLGATENGNVGGGGPGGAAVSADNTNGNAGNVGGNTTFGNWLKASGGGGGGQGNNLSTGCTSGMGSAGGGILDGGTGGGGFFDDIGGSGANAATAGSSAKGAGGGGGGGGIDGANANNIGASGGQGTQFHGSILTGGSNGAPGAPGAAAASNETSGGGGGGGGNAGNNAGGAGGNYGGGGAGGGGSLNGTNSGAGGNGAPGIAVIVTFF